MLKRKKKKVRKESQAGRHLVSVAGLHRKDRQTGMLPRLVDHSRPLRVDM